MRFDEKITNSEQLILNTNTTTDDSYEYDSTNAFANYDENTRINTGSSHIFFDSRFGLNLNLELEFAKKYLRIPWVFSIRDIMVI